MKENVTLGASIIAAIAASLCCLGPVAAALLGLGSFGAAAAFEKWRPILLAITVVLLAAAFYFTYRRREAAGADCSCATKGASRWNKIALWIATIVIVSFAAFPYYSGRLLAALSRQPSEGADLNLPAATDHLTKIRMRISGMTCGGCATALEAALRGIPGVQSAAASYEKGEASVEFDPARVKAEQLVEAVKKAGFKVETVTATIRVEGMTCAGCAASIQQALARREGVKSVEVNFEKKQAVVSFDPAKVTLEQVAETINQIGFKARL